ncbi:MAG: hypothetical protein IPP79_04905 [Chitinophagaceae bacterium]|nr:hypothetical protein [Chitinophagaceae bacterium]
MLMPHRSYASTANYRFGFNGQEMNNEAKGLGNSNFAEFWEYDTRIAKRWNIDPVIKDWESPYATFHNNPIWNDDRLGLDPPKKPGYWTRLWRKINYETYKTRAEEFANNNGIDESNIIEAEQIHG